MDILEKKEVVVPVKIVAPIIVKPSEIIVTIVKDNTIIKEEVVEKLPVKFKNLIETKKKLCVRIKEFFAKFKKK